MANHLASQPVSRLVGSLASRLLNGDNPILDGGMDKAAGCRCRAAIVLMACSRSHAAR
ncbi:MAG: hypothetical protein AB1847_06090 [bacterium]